MLSNLLQSVHLMVLVVLPCLALAQGQFSAERPKWKPGDRWEYRVLDAWTNNETDRITLTFERQDGDRLVGTSQSRAQAEPVATRADLDGNNCAPMLDSTQEVCSLILAFPLKQGGQTEYAKFPFANRQGHAQARCTVVATESVTVLAGQFEALRIECKGFWNSTTGQSYSGPLLQTYWYAPAAGRSVRLYFESRTPHGQPNNRILWELVSHTYSGS